VAAAAADQVQTSGLQASALEESLELVDDKLRQAARFLGSLAKRGPVLGHGLVQDAVLGTPAGVAV
jgi:hypothetical protein